MQDFLQAEGVYEIWCTDASGHVKWRVETPNLVMLQGANLMLDTAFSHASPGNSFSGLITSTNFGNITITDTPTNKSWTESLCAAARSPVAWSTAANGKKIVASPLQFTVSQPDTIAGGFVIFGSANATVRDPAGTLWSASAFQNGPQSVIVGDTISIQYVTTLVRTSIGSFTVMQVEAGRADMTAVANSPVSVRLEQSTAATIISASVHYQPAQLEAGASTSIQQGSGHYFVAASDLTVDTAAFTDAIALYHKVITEAGGAASTQDAEVFGGNIFFNTQLEAGAADFATTIVMHYAVTDQEGASGTTTSTQNARVVYAVSQTEGSITAASSQVGILHAIATITEGSNNASSIQAVVQTFLVDANGNYVLDANGNRIVVA